MDATPETFQALARSSPWRWSSAHLSRTDAEGTVEAWIRRPGWMRVRDPRQGEQVVVGAPYSSTLMTAYPEGWDGPRRRPTQVIGRPPQDAEPLWRDDGLVAVRPEAWDLQYGDPMWGSYQWVAMLDPVELSHGVRVDDVRAAVREGRATWTARLVPEPDYDPTCGCCALLRSEISDRLENDDDWVPPAGSTYPWAYDVGLDVESGIAVFVRAIGVPAPDTTYEVSLHELEVARNQSGSGGV